MNEDIDRLNKVLEDLRVTNDSLVGQCEVMVDVFGAVRIVNPNADPEAYGDLVAVLQGFQPEFNRLVKAMFDMHIFIAMVHAKVGT